MEWHPASFFRTDIVPETPFAILILNQPINENAFDAVRRHGTFSFSCSEKFNSVQSFDYDYCCSIHQSHLEKKRIHTPRRFYARASISSRALDEIEISLQLSTNKPKPIYFSVELIN
jgi:hypothetical protein